MIDPASYDITIQQNATYSKTFQLKDGDGVALNMTGFTVAAQLWTEGKGSKIADFAFAWVSQTTGKFTITLSAAITAELGQSAYYDILVTNSGGTKDYWVRGAAEVVIGYTK